MSSCESSEDEEELRKINEALIPCDLLASLAPVPETESENLMNDSKGHQVKRVENNGLICQQKSKRSDKHVEEDGWSHAYSLKTTPEFRAHIEKHLTQMLDREIQANLQGAVWKNFTEKRKQKGIKLFSGVKALCLGETDTRYCEGTSAIKSPPKIRPRKHKLGSSSSESSDEEKINSCVFTLDDIVHENKMLENLSKSGLDISSSKESKRKDTDSHELSTDNKDKPSPNVLKTEHKKKKKKKMRHGSDDEHMDQHSDTINEREKKKKKKKSKINCDDGIS